MRLANVSVRLHCAEFSLLKLVANLADGLPFCRRFGQSHEQTVGEQVAGFVAINGGHNHLGCAGIVERGDKFRGIALTFEPAQRPRGPIGAFAVQPSARLEVIRLGQQRHDEHLMNVFLRRRFQDLRRRPAKLRQRFVLPRRCAVFVRANEFTVEVDVVGQECSIAQPAPAAPAKLSAHGGQFHLELAVVMPDALNARALNRPVFAEQAARLAPLATDAMQQAVGVAFLGGEPSVLVPDAGNTVPLTVSERHFFAEQTVSIPGFLNRGSHVMCIALRALNVNFAPLNTNPGRKHSRSYPDFIDFFVFRHPETTDSRDEILKAKLPGGGGRVKVEAGAAGAHNLDATDAAIQSKGGSSRCPRFTSLVVTMPGCSTLQFSADYQLDTLLGNACNDMRLSDAQRDKLCEMMYFAFLEIRLLAQTSKATQAGDLADAFHNLPKEMWSEGFSLEDFREDFLVSYQIKYPEQITRNYVALLDAVIAIGNEDHSSN